MQIFSFFVPFIWAGLLWFTCDTISFDLIRHFYSTDHLFTLRDPQSLIIVFLLALVILLTYKNKPHKASFYIVLVYSFCMFLLMISPLLYYPWDYIKSLNLSLYIKLFMSFSMFLFLLFSYVIAGIKQSYCFIKLIEKIFCLVIIVIFGARIFLPQNTGMPNYQEKHFEAGQLIDLDRCLQSYHKKFNEFPKKLNQINACLTRNLIQNMHNNGYKRLDQNTYEINKIDFIFPPGMKFRFQTVNNQYKFTIPSKQNYTQLPYFNLGVFPILFQR